MSRVQRIIALTAVLLTATAVHAGTIHPRVQRALDEAAPDQPLSVIVHLREQAPVALIDDDLRRRGATRRQRHHEIVLALQQAALSQSPLRSELAAKSGAGVLGYTGYWITNAVVVQAIPAEIERIAARADVDFIEPNFRPVLIAPTQRVPGNAGKAGGARGIGVTPGLRAIGADRVWYEYGYTGAGRLVGSLDTGVHGDHPALASRWRGREHPWQECWLDVLGTNTDHPNDSDGHGTHTTGTMTGVAEDDTVGVAWRARWIACNAIDQGVSPAFDNHILAAFEWFADPDGDPGTVDDVPDVVQNSWGISENFPGDYTDCDSRWWAVIDNCEAAGVVTIWSAGNDGPALRTVRSPSDRADTPTNCFSVGAVDATNFDFPYPIAGFSSRGPTGCAVPGPNRIKPEVVAPGVDVYSSVPSGGYEGLWDGTSMSGPHVAGTVALMREANPDLDVDTIKNILMQTAVDEGDPAGEDNVFGWGFIDAYAAVSDVIADFGRLEGSVRNASHGGTPIPGAEIRIVDPGYLFGTDEVGAYGGRVAPGTYTVRASAPGFDTVDVTFVQILTGTITTQDFDLNDVAGPQIDAVSEPLAVAAEAGAVAIAAEIMDASTVVAAALHFRIDEGGWTSTPMTLERGAWTADLPEVPISTRIDYYVAAEDGIGQASSMPPGAPTEFFTLHACYLVYNYDAEDPHDTAWFLGLPGDDAYEGIWVREDPVGTWDGETPVQPEDDHTPDPGVACFVTGNAAPGEPIYANEVEGGCTTLVSPTWHPNDYGSTPIFIKYSRWYAEAGNSFDDAFVVEFTLDNGISWLPLEVQLNTQNVWTDVTVQLPSWGEGIAVRFVACDLGQLGIVEAAVDDFTILSFGEPATAVDDPATPTVKTYRLRPNHPNPFNPATVIAFDLPVASPVSLRVYDVSGRLVRTILRDEGLVAGRHEAVWNGRDDRGGPVGSGTYFYRLQAGDFDRTRKMVLLK